MNRIARLVAAGLLLSSPVAAQTLQAPAQLYNEGDLKLESGEAIKDFSISYVTFGTARRMDRRNSFVSRKQPAP
jgi:homoserine O-acetyltransferase